MVSGFPNWSTPGFLKELLFKATESDENQYVKVAGHPLFMKAIASEYGPKFNRSIDPKKEVDYSATACFIVYFPRSASLTELLGS